MAKTVLVVDDSASVRQVVEITLSAAGYDLIQAENGKKALNLLDGRKVHLVISDVNMPIMNGFAFVSHVKKLDHYKFTPVVMLTTEASEDMKQQGREVGAKAWIVKPFEPRQLLDVVSKLIPL